jgi:hypothetical protein
MIWFIFFSKWLINSAFSIKAAQHQAMVVCSLKKTSVKFDTIEMYFVYTSDSQVWPSWSHATKSYFQGFNKYTFC